MDSNHLINYSMITACLFTSLAFMLLVFQKVEKRRSVKISYSPLILFLISSLINLIISLSNSNVNILFKIFWFLTFISITILILLKVYRTEENYCNKDDKFKEDKAWAQYYEKVINRNKYDLIQPYKKVFDRYLSQLKK